MVAAATILDDYNYSASYNDDYVDDWNDDYDYWNDHFYDADGWWDDDYYTWGSDDEDDYYTWGYDDYYSSSTYFTEDNCREVGWASVAFLCAALWASAAICMFCFVVTGRNTKWEQIRGIHQEAPGEEGSRGSWRHGCGVG